MGTIQRRFVHQSPTRRKWKLSSVFAIFAIVVALIQLIAAISIIKTSNSNSNINSNNKNVNTNAISSNSSSNVMNNKFPIESLNKSESAIRIKEMSNIESHHLMSNCPREIETTQMATTLITQTTLDRLLILLETCHRWTSPIVASVYMTPQELSNQWDDISRHYSEQCHHMKLIPHVAKYTRERNEAYPINLLRNEALDQVNTSHVFLIDADFIPSVDLDQGIEKTIRLIIQNTDNFDLDRHALVVPAYERKVKALPCQDLQECLALTKHNPEFMPRSMQSLSQCVNYNSDDNDNHAVPGYNDNDKDVWLHQSKCIVFHSDYYLPGHGNTKSDEWLRNMDEEKVRTIPCISEGYEPYVVIPWCPNAHVHRDTTPDSPQMANANTKEQVSAQGQVQKDYWAPLSPYYDERFHGYGFNKIQQIRHLQAKGYQFSVIPALGFLTHHPHPISTTKQHWKGSKEDGAEGMMWAMENLYKKFEEELKERYGGMVEVKTKRCPEPRSFTEDLIAVLMLIGGVLLLLSVMNKHKQKGPLLPIRRSHGCDVKA